MAEHPYLDEASLGRFLRERLDPNALGDARVPGIVRQFRPDYRSERHKLIVEYDGDQHYRSAKHVIDDKTRDQALVAAGYTVIRVPYFVQMTEPVISLLFDHLITNRTPFTHQSLIKTTFLLDFPKPVLRLRHETRWTRF